MLTTLTIDDDVLAAAKGLTMRQRKTLGEVIAALSRHALQSSSSVARSNRNGVPLLAAPAGAKLMTLALEVTDSFLLALACAHGGQLASFDRRRVADAVPGGAQGLLLIQ